MITFISFHRKARKEKYPFSRKTRGQGRPPRVQEEKWPKTGLGTPPVRCQRGGSRDPIRTILWGFANLKSDKCTKTWSRGRLRPINIKGVHVHAFCPFCWLQVWPDLGSKFGLLGLDLGVTRASPQSWAADLGKSLCARPSTLQGALCLTTDFGPPRSVGELKLMQHAF